ncbi:MAG: vanadium-dependent haloperoxidase, partial [Bacteroidota bacterium]
IYTARDLATYVHYDALYEAYLNACLIMLGNGIPFDPGIPFQEPDNRDHQQGFAHFGGPHILSLVTEVATRALKAVRFQKFNVHRRCRPEVVAARIERANDLHALAPELTAMKNTLTPLLDKVIIHNRENNVSTGGEANVLLPMAFCEGSPMHPAYGAGHATVAGACVTILKAFFDHKHPLDFVPTISNSLKDELTQGGYGHATTRNLAYVPVKDGKSLAAIPILDGDNNLTSLTVEGELNKLASNISIGRNWAGVHYFTDYYESILLGEQVALGILEEQKITYRENFSMTVPLFNGDTIRI